jgi:hypothetical protein
MPQPRRVTEKRGNKYFPKMVDAPGWFSNISGHISATVRDMSNLTTAVYRSYYDKFNAIYRMPLSWTVMEKRGNKYFPKMVDVSGCFSNISGHISVTVWTILNLKTVFYRSYHGKSRAMHRMPLFRKVTEKRKNRYFPKMWKHGDVFQL